MDRLEQARLVLKYATDEIERIEAERAEAEKPELRHGDYGYDADSGDSFIVIEQSGLFGSPKAFYANQSGQVNVNESTVTRVHPGNIFADLKAIAEPLTEFPICSMVGTKSDVVIDDAGNITLPVGSETVWVCKTSVPNFILNLQRLQYTAERQKNDSESESMESL